MEECSPSSTRAAPIDGSLASFVQLPALPAQSPTSAPVAMNDNGVVVGASGQDGFNAFQPVLWKLNKKGKMTITDLKTLGGNKGKGLAVNNKGTVVGFAEERFSDALATIWTVNKKGKYVPQNLNDLVATKGMTLRYATGINEKGQIAVEAVDKNFKLHAILLTPSGVSGQTGAAKAAAKAPAVETSTPVPAKAPAASVFATKPVTEDQPSVWA